MGFGEFFGLGGYRHRSLSEGGRLAYFDIDAKLRPINVILGESFSGRQLRLMRDASMWGLMLTAKARCKQAMLRIDYVVWTHSDSRTTTMQPAITSKLVTVREASVMEEFSSAD